MGLYGNMALCGLLVGLTGVAMAQTADNPAMPSTHSTPAEQAQTNRLNNAAANDAASANQAAEQTNAQAQQRYQSQQQQYQAAKQDYAAQTARYHADRARYAAERAHYRRTSWEPRYEHELIVARSDLVGAHLMTGSHDVGRVQTMATGANGHVEALRVALHRGGNVWIDAADLRFDPQNHVVVTDLSRHDLHEMAKESF
jgi:molecular chaperone GrpE (heat shock protein)